MTFYITCSILYCVYCGFIITPQHHLYWAPHAVYEVSLLIHSFCFICKFFLLVTLAYETLISQNNSPLRILSLLSLHLFFSLKLPGEKFVTVFLFIVHASIRKALSWDNKLANELPWVILAYTLNCYTTWDNEKSNSV